MQTKWFVRAGAGLFVAIVVTVSVLQMEEGSRQVAPARSDGGAALAADPLRAELLHCQTIGQAGASDAACLRAWAENRRRFLTPGARPKTSPSAGGRAAGPEVSDAASSVGVGGEGR